VALVNPGRTLGKQKSQRFGWLSVPLCLPLVLLWLKLCQQLFMPQAVACGSVGVIFEPHKMPAQAKTCYQLFQDKNSLPF